MIRPVPPFLPPGAGALVFPNGEANGGKPPPAVQEALHRIATAQEMRAGLLGDAFRELASLPAGEGRQTLLASVMTGLMARGPAEDNLVELLGAALDLDGDRHVGAPDQAARVVVVAGSGKKGVKTLNISTPSSLLAAAAGASVVKMGSHATSSMVGSRDLSALLGLPQSLGAEAVRAAVSRTGFAFVPIEETIPRLDAVYGGRFHAVTPFSFGLAALASPLRVESVVFGLAHPRVELSARLLSRFGARHVVVVASVVRRSYYVDELGLGTRSLTCEARDGVVGEGRVRDAEELPGWTGFAPDPPAPRSPTEGLERVLDVLSGTATEAELRVVALNAAQILVVSGVVEDLAAGYLIAREALDDGGALRKLAQVQDSGEPVAAASRRSSSCLADPTAPMARGR